MKRKILAVLLMLSMFLSGFMSVNALTTSSGRTEDNVISSTQVDYGYSYTIRDHKGDLIKSANDGFIHSNGSQVSAGMFKYYDSNNNLIFCAELGAEFAKNATSSSQTTFKGTGPACGILKSMAGIDTSYEIGQIKSDNTNYKKLGLNEPLKITKSDFTNYKTNDASFIKLQRAIWKYQNYSGDCKNGNTVITNYKVKSQDFANTTLTLPTSATMNLSGDGKYYEATLNTVIGNENSLIGNITYTIDSPAIVERINNKQLKIKVEVAKYVNGMKLNLKATGEYKDYTNTIYTPVVTVYYIGTVNNEVDGVAQNISNAQDMATVSLEETSEIIKAPLSASSTVTLTVPNGSIEVLKTNSVNSTPVEGAKFNLYVKKDGKYIDATYLNGTKVGNLTTDKTGKILINNLPYGEYKIKETGAAPGYVYDEKNHLEREIVIDAKTSNYTGEKAIKITNDPIKVVISKKDVAKEGEIEGAKIAIYNYNETKKEKGEKVIEFTSKKEPFEYYLEPGVYALEETLAPASYQKLETTFGFEVEADGDVKLLDTYSDKNIITKNNAITIYNEVVVVPDTGSSSNIIYIIIGSILLLAGSGLIYLTIKKRKTESI